MHPDSDVAILGGGHRIVGAGGVVAGTGDDLHARELGEVFDRSEFGPREFGFGEPLRWDVKMIQGRERPIVGFDVEQL